VRTGQAPLADPFGLSLDPRKEASRAALRNRPRGCIRYRGRASCLRELGTTHLRMSTMRHGAPALGTLL